MPLSTRGLCVPHKVAVTLAVLSLTCAVPPVLSAQKPDKKADQKAESKTDPGAQDIQALVRIADAAMSGTPGPSDFPIQTSTDFLKAQEGRVWVPVTLTIDPAKLSTPSVMVYARLVPRGMTMPAAPAAAPLVEKDKKKDAKGAPPAAAAAPAYPFQDGWSLDLKPAGPGLPARIMRGFGAMPGSYDLYVVVREHSAVAGAPVKTSVLKQPIDIPNFTTEFVTSSVILAERVDQLTAPIPADQQPDRPYAFGQTEIVPSAEHKFKKSQELIVLYQIYNPMIAPDKKFSVEATYTFYRQGPDGEKRFNSTEPQTFSSDTMGAGFDPTLADRSIQAGQGVPLQSFPEGAYRLEIKLTDKLSAKLLTENVTFTVTP
jgi:hypothetical protein